MIDLSMAFDGMKEEIGFVKYAVDESISPKDNPDKFWVPDIEGLENRRDKKCLNWKYISNIFTKVGIYFDEPKNYFNEQQYNSCMHGNKWDINLPLSVKLGFGRKGIASQIIDAGEGFDFVTTVKNFYGGGRYSSHRGRGFVRFGMEENYVVSWEGKGNIANFMFKPKGRRDLELWLGELNYQLLKNSS